MDAVARKVRPWRDFGTNRRAPTARIHIQPGAKRQEIVHESKRALKARFIRRPAAEDTSRRHTADREDPAATERRRCPYRVPGGDAGHYTRGFA